MLKILVSRWEKSQSTAEHSIHLKMTTLCLNFVHWHYKWYGKKDVQIERERRIPTLDVKFNVENCWQNRKENGLLLLWLIRFVVIIVWHCNRFGLMIRTKCSKCSSKWTLILFNMPSKTKRNDKIVIKRTIKRSHFCGFHLRIESPYKFARKVKNNNNTYFMSSVCTAHDFAWNENEQNKNKVRI